MQIGMSMGDYWAETPKQFKKRIEVFEKEEKRKFKEMDTLNYYLGKYVGIAVNDPKKYPQNPFTFEKEEMSAQEMQSVARSITSKIKAKRKHGNNT